MYNPEFWEIQLEQATLERFPNESGIWFESKDDREARYCREDQVQDVVRRLHTFLSETLTEKQCEIVLLYFLHRKTQQEIAQMLGISRRVVSQHLFGICRNGKHIGGAVSKIRKICQRQGIEMDIVRYRAVHY